VAGVAGVAAGTGCIGTTDREDFDRTMAERGGGFTSELSLDAVDTVATELGTRDFEVRSLALYPPVETVVLEVRDPTAPGNLDRYEVRSGGIDSVEPVRLAAADDLDRQTFPVSSLALDRIESMVDGALAAFDREGAHVSGVSAGRDGDRVVFLLRLESPRAVGTARFTAEGEPIDATPT
jgi:hypothetical protein